MRLFLPRKALHKWIYSPFNLGYLCLLGTRTIPALLAQGAVQLELNNTRVTSYFEWLPEVTDLGMSVVKCGETESMTETRTDRHNHSEYRSLGR